MGFFFLRWLAISNFQIHALIKEKSHIFPWERDLYRGVNPHGSTSEKRKTPERKYYFPGKKNGGGHNTQTLRQDAEEKAEFRQSVLVRSPNLVKSGPLGYLFPGIKWKKEWVLELFYRHQRHKEIMKGDVRP